MNEPPPVVLHIPTSAGCNNRCSFCIDDGGATRRFSFHEHVAQLATARAFTAAIVFTTGEPTLNRDLPRLVAAAGELGFTQIGLITNGRRLRDARLCRALLEAGLTEVTVSLHGPDAAIHDGITGRPGSWAEARRGLANLRASPVVLRLNCTLVRANLGCMRRMADLAAEIPVDSLNFNTVEPRGRADRSFVDVVPRYSEVLEAADESGLDFGRPALSLSRVPACAGGCEWVQEDYHFTVDGEVTHYDPGEGKVRGPACARCAIVARCPGVWRSYAEHFGWEELVPVSAPRRGEVLRVDTGAPTIEASAPSEHSAASVSWSRQARAGFVRGYRRVLLGGGEPVLHPRFPEIVRGCRSIGFTEVAIESSARPLASVARSLAGLGVDRVVVALPGTDRRSYEAATGVAGSFRQAVAGLSALAACGMAFEIREAG